MIEIVLVGIASGDPRHLTAEAGAALAGADLVLIPRKGGEKAELAAIRHRLCGHLGLRPRAGIVDFALPRRAAEAADYLGSVHDWHAAIRAAWAEAVEGRLPTGGSVALLVWGDPALYDSSLRIAGGLRLGGTAVRVRVVPGITSLQLLCAAFAIPLNEIGAPFLVTTGRRLAEGDWPEGIGTVAVMLDGGCAFRHLDPRGVSIWWGAYLGMEGEILRSGPLAEIGPEIVALRAEARRRRGWIMDTYLLRR
jgi:precorrin-6A synthase